MSIADAMAVSISSFDVCQEAIIALSNEGRIAHCNKAGKNREKFVEQGDS